MVAVAHIHCSESAGHLQLQLATLDAELGIPRSLEVFCSNNVAKKGRQHSEKLQALYITYILH